MTGALDQAALELAALYALSALSADEMAAVERDWRAQREFWAEVRSLRDAAAGLAEVGPRAKPKRDLWPAICARIGHAPEARAPVPPQVWQHWPGSPRSSPVVPAEDGPFEPTDIAGISVRRLFVDPVAGRVTMLVRMQAGSAYPAHRHAGVEECYVLQGDLSIGDEAAMSAGDYQRMDTGSTHPIQSTKRGCLLLVTSSQHDELVV
jgi:quercetin dioxygenase-like cupin family protein